MNVKETTSCKPKTLFIAPYSIKDVVNTTLEKAYKYLKKQKTLGLDIETTRKYKKGQYNESVYQGGLDPYLTKIIMLQIGTLEYIFVIDVRWYDYEQLKPILELINYNKDLLIVGQNLRFEGKHLKHNYNINLAKIWDTMIAEMVLFNGMDVKVGLADLAGRYLGVQKRTDRLLFDELYDKTLVTIDEDLLLENEHMLTPFEVEDDYELDKSTRLQFLTIGDKPFTYEQVMYGADDIVHPLLIMERQLLGRKIADDDIYLPLLCIRLENSFSQVLADIELEGMLIDQKMWLEIADQSEKEYYTRKKELDSYVCNLYRSFAVPTMFKEPEAVSVPWLYEDVLCGIQWSSPPQVVNLLRKLKLCPRVYSKQTKKEEWTAGATELVKVLPNNLRVNYRKNKWIGFEKDEDGNFIEDNNRLILAIITLNKSFQSMTTFGRDWLKYIHPITGKVHSSYRQILNTGRMSSTKPNLQQLPGGKWRHPFIVGEGESMVCNDYSAQELRVLADKAEEQNMLDFFILGDPEFGSDLHSFSATRIERLITGDESAFIPPKEIEVDGETVNNPAFQPQHNESRNKSKETSFGVAYGKGLKGFAEDFGCSEPEAERFINGYFGAFPGLPKYFKHVQDTTLKQGYILIDKISGRRWFSEDFAKINELYAQGMEVYDKEPFKGVPKGEEREQLKKEFKEGNPWFKQIWREWAILRGRISRKALNFPIQGCLPLDSKILTPNGWQELRDFESGMVWTGECWASAIRVFRGKAPKIKLHLSDGREFVCDNRHKLLIKTDSAYPQWCHVNDIVGKELVRDGGYTTDWGRKILEPVDWYWFGSFIRHGYYLSSNSWGIVFSREEWDDRDKFLSWLNTKSTDLQITIDYTLDYVEYYGCELNATHCVVRITSESSQTIIKQWGIENGISCKKYIPDLVFTLDRDRRIALLKGWHGTLDRREECDNGVYFEGVRLTCISYKDKSLLQSLSQLCQTLGLTGVIENPESDTVGIYYDFIFHTTPTPLIVSSIEEFGYEEDMYTLSVHDERHSFSNEGLISKNTSASQSKMAACLLRDKIIVNKLPLAICNMIHDEMLAISRDPSRNKEFGQLVKDCMEKGGNYFCHTPKLMSATPQVGDHWIH